MKITCQSCQSKYTVSDDKVQGKTVKIKCRKCGSTIVVSSNGVTTTNGAGPGGDAGQATAAGTFLVNVAEGDQRSMTLQEVVDAYNASVVTPDTYVWADGMADWQPLGQVETIISALNTPGGGSQESMAAAAPRVAARRDPGRHAQDLFTGGGMEAQQQPAADDIATSAPLFGKGGGAAAKPKGEENSMLFSLSALTAKAAPAASSGFSAKAPAANSEDSGIIDLKALAAAADARSKSHAMPSTPPASSGFGALMPEDGGLFLAPPVLSSAPAAPAVVSPIEAPPKNRTPLFIGIGATVAIAAIVGAFMAMKGGGEPPPTAATENTAPAAVPTPTAVEPPPTPTAEASAAPTASASAVAAKGTFKPSGGGAKQPAGGTTKPAGGSAPAGGGATPAAPAAPKKGNCGCAPSDLMCAMKCAAK
jgi:predicted Zn finger-like uncharacterized protein